MKIRRFVLPAVYPAYASVLGRLGFNKNKTIVDDAVESLIKGMIENSGRYIHPAGNTFEDDVVEIGEDYLITGTGIELRSKKLAAVFQKSKKITFMVCTAGNEAASEVENLVKSGDMTRAVITDAVASESVEAFAGYITEVLTREKRMTGLKPTMRYSPGYGDFKTDIHLKILPLLKSEEIGITFNNENFILIPEKSISAVIGWIK